MTRPRDTQQEKLYRAERESGIRAEPWRTMSETQAYIDSVTKTAYWRKLGGVRVQANDGRAHRHACAYDVTLISLPRWSRQPIVILHELAHTIVLLDPKQTDHGRKFAKVFLGLVRRFMGTDAAKQLREAYRKNKVYWR